MYPRTEPYETGRLRRPDGAELYWEATGNPEGKPAVYLHGGPGGGLGSGGYRMCFDPEAYRLIGFDQRGCGRSTPLASDDLDHLDENTTQALIDDIEALREYLGVERWLVYGVSWGSTLALAYALAHPDRVTEIVIMAVTTTSRSEVDWITEGVGELFPEAWEQFAAASEAQPGERIVEAYARRLRDPDPDVRQQAADDWDAWESTHISLSPYWTPGPLHEDPKDRLQFATLVTHYWSRDGFLRDGDEILDRAHELRGIPGFLVHGRRDVSGPAGTAWRLHRAWPGSVLHVVESDGHGGEASAALVMAATDAFVD